MKRFPNEGQCGATFVEMLIASAISIVISGAALASFITVQKAIKASEAYSKAKTDEIRLTDYMARDLRRCLTVTASEVGADGNGTILQLTIPDYYDASGNPRTPIIT